MERVPPPALGPKRAPGFVEAAALCLTEARHRPGVTIPFKHPRETIAVRVSWTLRGGAQRSWDQTEATEQGAVLVGLALIRETLRLEATLRGRIGSGFDYWLSDDTDELRAVVEISGIRTGSDAQLKARLKTKTEQIRDAHGSLSAHALVVEFGQPRAVMVER